MFRRKEVSGRDFLELSLALESVNKWRDVLESESDVLLAPNEIAGAWGLVDVTAVDHFITLMEDRLHAANVREAPDLPICLHPY